MNLVIKKHTKQLLKPCRLILAVGILQIFPPCLSSFAGEGESEFFSAEGYRIAKFLAPVPDSVSFASIVTTEQLQKLISDRPVLLIDVLPTPVKPKDRPDHLLWLPPERYNIEGSHWLPNVGFGTLSAELDSYFKSNLKRLTKGDKAFHIVIYCKANCWMSWNAAKRAAIEYGYKNVYWYPDGTTGWESTGQALLQSTPVPIKYITPDK